MGGYGIRSVVRKASFPIQMHTFTRGRVYTPHRGESRAQVKLHQMKLNHMKLHQVKLHQVELHQVELHEAR